MHPVGAGGLVDGAPGQVLALNCTVGNRFSFFFWKIDKKDTFLANIVKKSCFRRSIFSFKL